MCATKKNRNNLLTYGKYYQLIEGIKYFQTEQTIIRFEVSRILLGTFVIIGALYFAGVHLSHFHPMRISIIVPILAIILIHTRMIEDLIIKERLRISSFAQAIKLEQEHDWLPKYNTNMFHHGVKEHHGSGHRKVKYYLGCIGILMLISATSFCLSDLTKNYYILSLFILLYVGIYTLYYRLTIVWVGKTSSMISKLKGKHGK
ncbi:MAG: hypothetical protein KDK71_04990 [Chlamydiia bacterium]|nr:hypothetical protein [Chlamydiia bacterium]MCB9092855.1 hypothetical protein [Halobacteriovoraceae bacterium]